MIETASYTVHLDAFEGPMDLLLYLIKRAEVEITEIPIARIAEEYIAFLEGIERIDIDKAGEFLLMAATLTEIKSRILGANAAAARQNKDHEAENQATGHDEPDPLAELVSQLLEYKRFRDAAEALEHRFEEWNNRFPAGRTAVDAAQLRAVLNEERQYDLEDVSIVDLVEAFDRLCETINFDRLGEHEVIADDTPIELHAADMLDRLKREADAGRAEMTLHQLFIGRSRSEMLGLFLALLELVRNRKVKVAQESGTGEITLVLRREEPAETNTSSSEESAMSEESAGGATRSPMGSHESRQDGFPPARE